MSMTHRPPTTTPCSSSQWWTASRRRRKTVWESVAGTKCSAWASKQSFWWTSWDCARILRKIELSSTLKPWSRRIKRSNYLQNSPTKRLSSLNKRKRSLMSKRMRIIRDNHLACFTIVSGEALHRTTWRQASIASYSGSLQRHSFLFKERPLTARFWSLTVEQCKICTSLNSIM